MYCQLTDLRSEKNSSYGNSELRKVSSESDSITGFGIEGGVTRHYTGRFSFLRRNSFILFRKWIIYRPIWARNKQSRQVTKTFKK
jgi:hypothetical protein